MLCWLIMLDTRKPKTIKAPNYNWDVDYIFIVSSHAEELHDSGCSRFQKCNRSDVSSSKDASFKDKSSDFASWAPQHILHWYLKRQCWNMVHKLITCWNGCSSLQSLRVKHRAMARVVTLYAALLASFTTVYWNKLWNELQSQKLKMFMKKGGRGGEEENKERHLPNKSNLPQHSKKKESCFLQFTLRHPVSCGAHIAPIPPKSATATVDGNRTPYCTLCEDIPLKSTNVSRLSSKKPFQRKLKNFEVWTQCFRWNTTNNEQKCKRITWFG